MQINRRALYNSLRLNWVLDPSLEVESWQVEDYRSLPLDEIFERLEDTDIHLDRSSFVAFADNFDTPEDLADDFLSHASGDTQVQDQVYLLVFELWRRLLPEKACLSIFCDELDQQIHLYDSGHAANAEGMQDVLANLQVILDENCDEGADPVEAFKCIEKDSANDIESFLYDFIAEQIDNKNFSYATELLDGFSDYVQDVKWFDFLRARAVLETDTEEANQIVRRLIEENAADPNLEFNIELLSFLVRGGDKTAFNKLVKQSASLIRHEEDFQDIVSISADFYHCLDHEPVEQKLQGILKRRLAFPLHSAFDSKDPQLSEFFKIIS
jgi:hypothetical protein